MNYSDNLQVLPYVLTGDIIDDSQEKLYLINTGDTLTGVPTFSQSSDDPYGTLNLTSYQLYKNIEILNENIIDINETTITTEANETISGEWVFTKPIAANAFIGNGSQLTNISYYQLNNLPDLSSIGNEHATNPIYDCGNSLFIVNDNVTHLDGGTSAD